MERQIYSVILVLLTVSILSLEPAHATNQINILFADFAIVGQSGPRQLISGQYVQSKSYARFGTAEYFDPGYLINLDGWRMTSGAEVTSGYSTVDAYSETPVRNTGYMQWAGLMFDVDVDQPVDIAAWTNVQTVYSPTANESVDMQLYHSTYFNCPSGLYGNVTVYFGIWQNDISPGNLMLDEKDGWTLAELNFEGQTYQLLQQTFTTNLFDASSLWSLDFHAGNEYKFFTHVVGEVVPEPTTLLLLATGACLLRSRKR